MDRDPIDFGPRLCWFCGQALVEFPKQHGEATQHCKSPGCHWCESCERKRRAGLPITREVP